MITQQLKYEKHYEPHFPDRRKLPTMYDLPSENPEEPGVPDQFHTWQSDMLTQTFSPPDYKPEEILVASDLNLYYDVNNTGNYKRPDWYAVLGVPYLYEKHDLRLSYVIWQEEVVPFIVIELLSPGTEKEDLGMTLRKADELPTKWEVYEQILGIPYYAEFSRYTDEFRAFGLSGHRYIEIPLKRKRLWLPEIKLGLGLWNGKYKGLKRRWLRWYDSDNKWIPNFDERNRLEKKRAEHEKKCAEHEKKQKKIIQNQLKEEQERTKRLIEQLKAAGIKPELKDFNK